MKKAIGHAIFGLIGSGLVAALWYANYLMMGWRFTLLEMVGVSALTGLLMLATWLVKE